jgi:hypothetical protein
MSPQDDEERARGGVRREYSLALQATCGVAGRKPNVQVDIWRWRNFVIFHRMGLSICNGRLAAVMGLYPSLINWLRP